MIIRNRKLTRRLECRLTDDEIRGKLNELAASHERERQLEAELELAKAAVKQVKELIADESGLQSQTSKVVSDRHEERSVECEEIFDFESGRVAVRRLDTLPHVVVGVREMTQAERQMVIARDSEQLDRHVADAIDVFERQMGRDLGADE